MISIVRLDFRIVLRPGVTPAERLALMEVVEKWAVRRTGARPARLISSSTMILFAAALDRQTAADTLRECLPLELVEDVMIGGVSWNQ